MARYILHSPGLASYRCRPLSSHVRPHKRQPAVYPTMNTEASTTYLAIVWVGEAPGERVEVVASSLQEALATLRLRYGDDATISAWNEEDSDAKR